MSYTLALEKDSDIVNELIYGDTELAATVFVRKYQKFVYSAAFRYVQNYEDADDIAQEVFIKALENIKKFRGESSLKTWLYRITANQCNSFVRKRKFFSFFSRDLSIDEIEELPASSMTPEQAFENKEFEIKFKKILSQLPEKQRETFALRYFEEMPYEEISKLLGTSVGGLKANYYQAVQKLALLLKKVD